MSETIVKEKKSAPLSRLGRKPVDIPAGVKVHVDGGTIHVEGSRGKLSWTMHSAIGAKVNGNQVDVAPVRPGEEFKALHGLSRKLVFNMVEGVTKGFHKKLMVEGVGFRVVVAGDKINMVLGYSHPVTFQLPKGIVASTDPKIPNLLTIEGTDKQKVGQVAAQIRSLKKPEPYKGTGIRYEHEVIKRKAGKAAVGSTGAPGGGGAKK